MKFALSLVPVAAACLAIPAVAQEETPVQQGEAKESTEAKEAEKICKRVALGMDSRRKERVCLTPSEWRKLNLR
ncbi:hypothetical protein ACWPM1_08140 [Tsuneonella sp. HG249]